MTVGNSMQVHSHWERLERQRRTCRLDQTAKSARIPAGGSKWSCCFFSPSLFWGHGMRGPTSPLKHPRSLRSVGFSIGGEHARTLALSRPRLSIPGFGSTCSAVLFVSLGYSVPSTRQDCLVREFPAWPGHSPAPDSELITTSASVLALTSRVPRPGLLICKPPLPLTWV